MFENNAEPSLHEFFFGFIHGDEIKINLFKKKIL